MKAMATSNATGGKKGVQGMVETPWHGAFPAVKCMPDRVTKEEVLSWFLRGEKSGRDFVLVDVRRVDREVDTYITFFPSDGSVFLHKLGS